MLDSAKKKKIEKKNTGNKQKITSNEQKITKQGINTIEHLFTRLHSAQKLSISPFNITWKISDKALSRNMYCKSIRMNKNCTQKQVECIQVRKNITNSLLDKSNLKKTD